jgi:clan AA aspartic protease
MTGISAIFQQLGHGGGSKLHREGVVLYAICRVAEGEGAVSGLNSGWVVDVGITFTKVEIGGRRYRALVDTGFNGEVAVSRRVAEEAGLAPFRTKERVLADGRVVKVGVAVAVVKIGGEETEAFVEIIDELPLDVLVGVQALERLGYVADPKTGRIEKIGLILV